MCVEGLGELFLGFWVFLVFGDFFEVWEFN